MKFTTQTTKKPRQNNAKRGVASISWILTIVFMVAVMGIIWLAVEPATSGLSTETETQIDATSTHILDEADMSEMQSEN